MKLSTPLLCGVLGLLTTQSAQPSPKSFQRKLYGTYAVAAVVGGAVWGQVWNAPREWGRGGEGFAKRLASGAGEHAVKLSIETGVAALRHEDLSYHPYRQGGFKPRLEHALLSTVYTTKTNSAHRTVASGRISGDIGAGLISRVWQPARFHTFASGFSTGGIFLGLDAGLNVLQEFWPEIRHPRSHHGASGK